MSQLDMDKECYKMFFIKEIEKRNRDESVLVHKRSGIDYSIDYAYVALFREVWKIGLTLVELGFVNVVCVTNN
ncbi:MAG: hypothetical protein QXG06_02775 [Desulfurococcaceae archaeon]